MRRTSTERFGELLFYAVVVLMAYLAFLVIQPFFAPLAWAAIFALALHPAWKRLAARTGPTRAALITTLGAAVLIIGPLTAVVSMLLGELPMVVAFTKQLPSQATPERVQVVWDNIRARVPASLPEDPTQLLSQAAQSVVSFLAPRLGGAVANLASMIGSLFVMLFALFFLLRDGDRAGQLIRRLLPFPEAERERLIRTTHDLVIASVGAGLSVAAVQGIIGGLAFWALGIGAPAAWGVAMAVCAVIPVVGTTLIWGPVAIWWLLSGEVVKALVLAGIGMGVIGSVDNLLRPLLLSGRTSVNGLVVFIGLLGGLTAFGFVGLVLGPIVLVTSGTLLDALTRQSRRPAETPPEDMPAE
ncbi:MAG: AI-2E family transporter [Vicinamibacterales bacterium]